MALQIPTIHLNGTSKKELLDDLCNAYKKLSDAIVALRVTCPHSRDYYVQKDGELKYREARIEFIERENKLQEVMNEISTIAERIQDQD
jgi:hypothetical protein